MMEKNMTNEQMACELAILRRRVAELEAAKSEGRRTGHELVLLCQLR